MAPAKVRDTDVVTFWNKMIDNTRQLRRLAKTKYRLGQTVRRVGQTVRRVGQTVRRVGQTVRISKEKMNYSKGGEQNYTTEIFRISNVVYSTPRPVYELEDLRGQKTEGQFYTEKLTPISITKQTTYKVDKILDKRVRRGILEYLVRSGLYSAD
jgi:hypothetical protein